MSDKLDDLVNIFKTVLSPRQVRHWWAHHDEFKNELVDALAIHLRGGRGRSAQITEIEAIIAKHVAAVPRKPVPKLLRDFKGSVVMRSRR